MTYPTTDTSSDATWSRRFLWLLAGVFVFRALFILLFTAQADLAGDEAYYWDWGRRLDWGYFSKPPMIGWLMGLVGWLTHDAEWGVRGAALVLGTGTLWFLFLLARRLYDARTAFLASTLILLTPGNAGLNLFFTIDAPLLLTWSAALLVFWFAAEKPTCWTRWLTLALIIGLGTLSKQMMLIFPLIMVIFAAVSPTDRALLKNPRLWIAIVIGMLFLTPNLLWNQHHHWITLEHTKHHFDTKSLNFIGWLERTVEFPGVQALVYSPVTFVALIAIMWLGMRNWRQMQRRERFLLLFCAPALAAFTILALRQRINPNWPAVFYVPAFILAAAWWNGYLPFTPAPGWRRWSLRIANAMTILVYLGITVLFLSPLKGHKKLNDLRGWNEVGTQAGAYLAKVPRPNNTFVLTLGHRYDAAQMAFNMPQHPRVYRWESSGHVMSQYEVWPGPEERIGDDALILVPTGDSMIPLPGFIATCFESVDTLGRVEVKLSESSKHLFNVFLGHKLLYWQAVGADATPAP